MPCLTPSPLAYMTPRLNCASARPMLGRFSVLHGCLFFVLFHTVTVGVHPTKVALRLCTPLLGRFSVPRDCLFVISFDTNTISVHATNVALRRGSVPPWSPSFETLNAARHVGQLSIRPIPSTVLQPPQ